MDATKSKKKAVILAVSIAAAAVLVGIVLAAVAGGGKAVLQDQLNLGAKYLEELNYERAVAAYEAALKVDPKNTAAYEGIVAAYRGMGDAAKAAEYAQKGYEETGAESLSALLALLSEEEEGEDGGYDAKSSAEQAEQTKQTKQTKQTEQVQPVQPVQPEKYLAELFDVGGYESFGLAYGGSIPVQKNEKWGAVNFQNEVIVPFEYDGFWSPPDQSGHFVLYNVTLEERLGIDGTPYQAQVGEYFLFDNQGKVIYQGKDRVYAFGGMYVTLSEDVETGTYHIEYHSMDGRTLASEVCVYLINGQGLGFYDGAANLCAVRSVTDVTNLDWGYFIGTVDLQGNISWREAPWYTEVKPLWEEEEARYEAAMAEAERNRSENNGLKSFQNPAKKIVFFPRMAPISGINHGYYVTFYVYADSLYVYNGEDEKIAKIYYRRLGVDENGGVTYKSLDDEEEDFTFDPENSWIGFFKDGGNIYNYGSKMVFTVGEKYVLIDFAKNTAGADSFGTEETVLAVYDDIAMADGKYWLVQSGERWGYIDHEGNELAMYQDAGAFVNGYALIKENGEAWLIDESFQKLENLGPADSVSVLGELYCVTVGEERRLYTLTGAGRE